MVAFRENLSPISIELHIILLVLVYILFFLLYPVAKLISIIPIGAFLAIWLCFALPDFYSELKVTVHLYRICFLLICIFPLAMSYLFVFS